MKNLPPRFFPFFYLALRRPKTFFRTYFKEQNVGWPFITPLKFVLGTILLLIPIGGAVVGFAFPEPGHEAAFSGKLFVLGLGIALLLLIFLTLGVLIAGLSSVLLSLIYGASRHEWRTVLKVSFYQYYAFIPLSLFFLALYFAVSLYLGIPGIECLQMLQSKYTPLILLPLTLYSLYFEYAGLVTLTQARRNAFIIVRLAIFVIGGIIRLLYY